MADRSIREHDFVAEACRAAGLDLSPDRTWFALDGSGLADGSASGIALARREGWSLPTSPYARELLARFERLPANVLRLERMRPSSRRIAAPLTLGLLPVWAGGRATVVVIVEPGLAVTGGVPRAEIDESRTAEPTRPAPRAAPPAETRKRICWSTDDAGRLTDMKDEDLRRLGARSGEDLSIHLAEIASRLGRDLPFTALDAIWSGLPDGGSAPVQLSGVPAKRSDGSRGFRGFLLYRPSDFDEAGGRTDPPPQAEPTAPDEASPQTVRTSPGAFPAIFNAIVDVSLNSWSNLIGALPATRQQAAIDGAAPAADASGANETPRVDASLPEPLQSAEAPHGLSITEQGALSEIARVLGARIETGATPTESERESATVLPLVAPRLRESEVRAALDGSRMAAIVHGADRVLFANQAFLDLTGPADMPMLQNAPWAAELLRRDGAAPSPARLALPAGDIEVVSAPTEWAGKHASLTLAWPAGIDVGALENGFATELAQRDERLADLQTALQTVDGGVITVDAAGRITGLSGAAQTLFGYGENEIAGEQLSELFGAESRREAFSLVERARLDRLETGEKLRATGLRRDGSTVELELSARRVGAPEAGTVLVAISDATQRRAFEETLGAAHREVEAAHRQAGEMLSRVGHEIRSPLTAIIGFADLLLEERLGPLHDGRVRPYLEGIRSSGMDVIERMDQFRRYTDALTGRIDTAPEPADLNTIISDTVGALQNLSVRERVVLRTSLPPGLPPAWLDADSVRQAANHLLTAAIMLSPPGGQVITGTALVGGELSWSVRPKDARLSAADIDAALRPFSDQPGSLVVPRTGFALALAKALIAANGADLTVMHRANEAPLLEVRFPVAAAPAIALAAGV